MEYSTFNISRCQVWLFQQMFACLASVGIQGVWYNSSWCHLLWISQIWTVYIEWVIFLCCANYAWNLWQLFTVMLLTFTETGFCPLRKSCSFVMIFRPIGRKWNVFSKKSGKWGVFGKKVDLSSTQGALCTVPVFFILHFTHLGCDILFRITSLSVCKYQACRSNISFLIFMLLTLSSPHYCREGSV